MRDLGIVWDRTNIGENYPGVTHPFTYSFIKDAYSRVYEQFLLRLGVDKEKIELNKTALNNMLGYIKGHIFYNIDNWYSFLKFLPGYRFNKRFFEAMLDPVAKKSDEEKEDEINVWESIRVTFNFFVSLIFFRNLHNVFEKKFLQISQDFKKKDLKMLNNFEIVNLFENMEKRFFNIWAITIINDFKVMIFYGLLSKLASKNESGQDEIMKNLYSLKNQPRSILPLKEIVKLTTIILGNKSYSNLFLKETDQILKSLNTNAYANLNKIFISYLDEYGERSSNELKLEEPKFKENPEAFIRLIKYYTGLDRKEISRLSSNFETKTSFEIPKSYSFKDRLLLNFLKSITTRGIYQREYYRMRRGKAFNMARKMILTLGDRLKIAGDLAQSNDVFYLYKHELFDYVRYHALACDFKKTVLLRRKLFEKYRKEDLPRRLTTNGLPNAYRLNSYPVSDSYLRGQATSKGVARGEAVVMENLDLTADFKGKILVTKATDPGWTIIFPLLKGIITEHGGVLSHASIIARELGIPCIVKVEGATTILKSHQRIEMDATNGKVLILN